MKNITCLLFNVIIKIIMIIFTWTKKEKGKRKKRVGQRRRTWPESHDGLVGALLFDSFQYLSYFSENKNGKKKL